VVRAEERRSELALRAALGASRPRIVRGLMTESVVLSLAGAALGVGFAETILYLAQPFAPAGVPFPPLGDLDGSVLAVTFSIALVTGLVFGLLPGYGTTRRDLLATLSEHGRGGTGRSRTRVRSALVVVEVPPASGRIEIAFDESPQPLVDLDGESVDPGGTVIVNGAWPTAEPTTIQLESYFY